MRAVFVVVRHVLREDLLEMTATEDEESVETLSAGRAYESLGDRRQGSPLPRRARRCPGHVEAAWTLFDALVRR